ncbi:MAG: hypothetical protein WBB24_09355, partial [Maribacter sp.]
DTSVSTLADNGDGTYTYTDESGATQNIDTNASANPYDNTTSGLTATNVQQAIDEINAAAGTVALVDNGDGTYDFTNAAGVTTTISDTSVSTLTDNGDGTYTYTDESGTVQNIDTNASSNPYDNTTSGLTATNVQQAIDEINAAAGTVALVDNGDGTYDFTNAAGVTTTISDTSVSTLADNGDGTYTYTDESGAVQNIDTNASSNPYDNSTSGLTATNVQQAIDEINAAAGTVALVDNGDGTYDFTNAEGVTTTISDTSVSTLADNGDGTYTYTDESGATQNIDTNASANPYDNTTSGLTATNVQQAIDEINAAAGTVALVDNGDGTYDFTNAAGVTTTISDTSVSTLADNGDGTYTYTDEAGNASTINTNGIAISNLVAGNRIATLTEADGTISEINETITSIVDNNDGNVTLVNEAGASVTIAKSDITANPDGTYTFTNNDGSDVTIDTNGLVISNLVAGNRIATITEADGTTADINETITSIIDNNDGTVTFTREDNSTQTISKSQITDNGDSTFTFDNGNGSPVVFVGTDDQVASEVDFTPSGNTASTTVQAAIEELQGDINGLDGTDDQDLGIGSGGVANESVEVTITDGSSALVDIRDADSSITNELSQVGAGTPAVTGATASNTGETYVDTTSGQLYVWDGSAWQQVGGSAAPDADPDPTNELSDIAITGTTLELTNAAAGATGVDLNNTFATDTELANAIAASEAADLDKDATNELQNLGEVLADGNDGAGLAITNIADPTNPQDAATKAYVDSISDDDVSIANTVSGNRIATISEPGITDVDINETITTLGDANSDGIFDFESENGTITSFDGTDDQTAAQVSLTPAGNITSTDVQSALEELDANSSDNQDLNLTGDNLTLSNDPTATPIDLSDYRETVTGTNDITVTDDGNGNYTVDYVDGDKSDSNEITTVTDNLDGTTTILDVNGGTVTVDNDGIDNVDDADNDPLNEIQDASQVSFDDATAGLGATDTQAAIVALAASNAADNDTDATNEYNTGSAITGGNLEITDGGGTESVNLISTDANNNIAVGSDGALYLNVASVTISETITSLADNGNGSFTYTNEAGSPVTFQASTITNNGDGTSTIALADGGSITVDNDGVDNVDDADNVVGNEYNTGISFDGTDLTITDGGGDQTIDITGVNTDTQDLSIDATGKIISLVDGGSVTINADDADADPNNEIQDLSISGNTLSLSGDATTVDLSPFVNNDTNELQTLSQSGTDVTLSDGGGTISVADNDNSVTNEVNTAFTVAAGNLNITDS